MGRRKQENKQMKQKLQRKNNEEGIGSVSPGIRPAFHAVV